MLIDIDKVKVGDRIRKDFGNLQELADDIKENGLINPPIVTPDTYELLAGERRLRAMKLLGYNQVEVRPMSPRDAEHALNLEISENESRKDFSKSERIEYARRLERIEAAKAKERKIATQNNDTARADCENFRTLIQKGRACDLVAEKLSIGSGRQYEKEKYIVDNKDLLSIEDFAEWDEGKLSTNKAYQKIKQENTRLKEQLSQPKPVEVKVVDNTDYNLIESLKSQITSLESELSQQNQQKQNLEAIAKLTEQESLRLQKIQDDIRCITQQKDSLGKRLRSVEELAGLVYEVQETLEKQLAPVKFKRCMDVLDRDEVVLESLKEIVSKVENWTVEMKSYLHEDCIVGEIIE